MEAKIVECMLSFNETKEDTERICERTSKKLENVMRVNEGLFSTIQDTNHTMDLTK